MTRFLSERNLQNIAQVSLVLAAGACLVLWFVRIYCAISFTRTYMMVTTGCEEESLFAIWRFVHGQAVYADPNQIPFAASYFNWGYYGFYGSITKFWLNLLHLDSVWIPTIGRLVSLLFTLISGGVFYLALRRFGNEGWFSSVPTACAWCVISVFGPLTGFWSITVRPDMGALAFECSGLYLVLCYLQKRNLALVVVATLFFYAGWSFKQTAVSMLTGSALTLLLVRDWRAFLTLGGLWWFLVLLAFALGGGRYRECVLFSQVHLPMTASLGMENGLRAEVKNVFFLPALLLTLYFFLARWRALAARPVETAVALVVLCGVALASITSCKLGASDNYYIPAAWAAMLGVGLNLQRIGSRLGAAGLAGCSWIMITVIALSPTAHTFYYDYRASDPVYRMVAAKLAHLPGPVFVTDRYANLPWVQPSPPYFVLGYAYDSDRRAGVACEQGGWEGLIGEGYFGTVVLAQGVLAPPSLAQKYELVDEYQDFYNDYKFYRRKLETREKAGKGPVEF